MRLALILLASLVMLAPAPRAHAAVQVIVGPTPIPAANARNAADITVVNERLAFALAVGSAAPFGVPRGAIVAVAPVHGATIGRNRVVFADFIPDNWSAWPNTYHHVEILERGPQQARIRAVRDWGQVTITTLYRLAARSDEIAISTTMTNGGARPLPHLLSGLTLWPNSGYLFAVPGLAGVTEGPAERALSDRVVAYDADWSVALHAPYLDHVGSGSRDLFLLHTLEPGASRTFEGRLQVGPSGDLAPVVQEEIDRRRLPAGRVHGRITTRAGTAVGQPVVVVEKDAKPYAWVLGRDGTYRLALPAGEYTLYATARHYSHSAPVVLHVAPGTDEQRDFGGLESPGSVRFEVTDSRTGVPLDARIVVAAGEKPLVGFLGRTTFFTALEPKGRVQLPIAPGDYRFTVSSGAGFLGPPAEARLTVVPGRLATARIALTRLFDPTARGWYAADLHHHADQAEAVTPPPDLARSQLAAGLDLLFVSDHDSTVNHAALREIAAGRAVPFIPGIELSPSWGHFNAYPLTPGATLSIDTSTASVREVLEEARREGAVVVQVNHPFNPYGYFASLAAGLAPGGYDPGFDLIEINSSVPGDDSKVLARAWDDWNAGRHDYLSGGSDTHDVWNDESGRVRTYVHVDGTLGTTAFVAALKAGHAYVTYGPLIFPSVMFGTALTPDPEGRTTLGCDLAAVAGLKQVGLIGGGSVRTTRSFADGPREAHVEFTLDTGAARWYALVVEDSRGHKAYTDPIWVGGEPGAPSAPREAQP